MRSVNQQIVLRLFSLYLLPLSGWNYNLWQNSSLFYVYFFLAEHRHVCCWCIAFQPGWLASQFCLSWQLQQTSFVHNLSSIFLFLISLLLVRHFCIDVVSERRPLRKISACEIIWASHPDRSTPQCRMPFINNSCSTHTNAHRTADYIIHFIAETFYFPWRNSMHRFLFSTLFSQNVTNSTNRTESYWLCCITVISHIRIRTIILQLWLLLLIGGIIPKTIELWTKI